ncbi:MAG: sigma-70 family RNA polymerase sigma factor [Prevotella sp.]|nr:sigma-70 family RNA polymerase sigma factor [Prevotella sp.]
MQNFKKMSDDTLVTEYLSGNSKAFDELLSRYQSKLFSYIVFMVKNHDTANDLFQETFVKVIVQLHDGRYVANGKFYPWLTRIAHNVIVDYFRLTNEMKVYEAPNDNDLSNIIQLSTIDINKEEEIVRQQVLSDVKTLMEKLPAAQSEIVYMRYYQNLSFKEIAEVTGVSINTALGRMRYALINMRRLMHKHDIWLEVV